LLTDGIDPEIDAMDDGPATSRSARRIRSEARMPDSTRRRGWATLCHFAAVAADESVVGGSLGTRHSRVTGKIGAGTAWIRARPPASLPRFAGSDDGHFAPGELPARPRGLSCDSQDRCLQPSLPLRLRCRYWATSSDLHCKSLIRIGRTTVIVPSVRRNVVESWQVQNYSKWNNDGRRGRLSAKFNF
jgi:hypothetical protein